MSLRKVTLMVAILAFWGVAALAQDAKVKVTVYPPEAYVFLDGAAVRPGNVTLKTTAGEHTIGVYNYGFQSEIRAVTLQAGKNAPQAFTLQRVGEPVPGEFGILHIEGPVRAAVLLNGTTPEYHVGHVDMFNNRRGTFQQLILLPGTHQVTILQGSNTLWSGAVEIKAGERVILRVPSGNMTTKNDGKISGPRTRFDAGINHAAITIAPVSATLAATPGNINCNETSKLAYTSVDALHTTMKDDAEAKKLPDLSGEMGVSPRKTTTYEFEASGPGGLAKQQATVNVNPVVQSTLEATPTEMHYLKVGDKILVQDSSDLKWTITNADAMSISPIGTVQATGQQKLTAEPKAANGKIDEAQTYVLTASNVCGGSDSKTAEVRTKGVIESSLLSVFFPTGYPDKKHPEVGLVASQQERLMALAGIFPLYLEHTPDAKIVIRGFADPRGPDKYNMALSERRIAVVKNFLVAHGIPEDKITTEPLGKTQVLNAETVAQLETENPFKNEGKEHKARTLRMAYNRRIDIEVQPASVQTSRFFPHPAGDAHLLLQPTWASHKMVTAAQETPTVATAEATNVP